MTACPMSGRGDCCDGHDGHDVTCGFHVGGRGHENVKTEGWSLGIAACPKLAGSVWYKSSWASSWVSP